MNNYQLSMIKVDCSLFILLFAIFSALGGLQCEKPTPTDYNLILKNSLTLAADDIGVTETWLKVKFLDTTVNRTFKLVRDGQTILTARISLLDTVIMDDNLLPNHLYNYTALRLVNCNVVDSAILSVPTLDTTSHNFTWEIDTLGDGNNSVLRDVAIINDTCIWAVGEIYKKDSTGQFETQPYGAAVWNGTKWKLMKVPYHDYGTTNTYPGPLRSVFGFSPNEVYVTSYANLLRWNGTSWQEKAFFMTGIPFTGQVNKIWGPSGSNLYCAGNSGSIYNYNGSSWKKIESGTTSDIQDVWGVVNEDGNNEEVYCAVSSSFVAGDQKILKVTNKGNKVDSIPCGTGRNILSIWTENGNVIYTAGSGVFESSYGSWQEAPLPTISTNSIRGTSRTNIFVAGDFGMVAHYNGMNWHVFNDVFNAQYFSISINENIVICVGQRDGKGIALIGKRN